jgi:hypothetical protein
MQIKYFPSTCISLVSRIPIFWNAPPFRRTITEDAVTNHNPRPSLRQFPRASYQTKLKTSPRKRPSGMSECGIDQFPCARKRNPYFHAQPPRSFKTTEAGKKHGDRQIMSDGKLNWPLRVDALLPAILSLNNFNISSPVHTSATLLAWQTLPLFQQQVGHSEVPMILPSTASSWQNLYRFT